MRAMTSPSWIPSVVTCIPVPFDFLTTSQCFRRGKSADKRHEFNRSMTTQNSVAADTLATHAETTASQAPDLSHGYTRLRVSLVET
jgi:hypothetical protein